jgi:hypothetical protein
MANKKVEIHARICRSMTDLYERKNHDYGDSFAKMRKEFDNAILIRIYDKFSRLKTLKSGATQKVSDENIKDTLFDLANYCIMELVEMEVDENESK